MPRRSNQAAPLKAGKSSLLLTSRQSVALGNMHWRRRCAILRRMEFGASFSAAEKATYHVFDTVGWHEITSRLRRARGFVLKWASILANSRNDVGNKALMSESCGLATRIAEEARGLREVMKRGGYWRRSKTPPGAIVKVTTSRNASKLHSSQLILGKFKAALRFVAKSHRDVPHLIQDEIAPTVQEQAKIAAEIQCLLASTNLLK